MIKLNNKPYLKLFIIYLISFILVILLNKVALHNNSLYKILHKCGYYNESDSIEFLTSTRGSNYYTFSDDTKIVNKKEKELDKKNHMYCLISLWALTHVGLYIVIGFYCPNLFIETFIIGVLFEFFEKYYWNCQDSLDVIFNSIGFGIGYSINKFLL